MCQQYYCTCRRRYGLFHFVWDVFLGVITCGLWWVYLIFRAANR